MFAGSELHGNAGYGFCRKSLFGIWSAAGIVQVEFVENPCRESMSNCCGCQVLDGVEGDGNSVAGTVDCISVGKPARSGGAAAMGRQDCLERASFIGVSGGRGAFDRASPQCRLHGGSIGYVSALTFP